MVVYVIGKIASIGLVDLLLTDLDEVGGGAGD